MKRRSGTESPQAVVVIIGASTPPLSDTALHARVRLPQSIASIQKWPALAAGADAM